MSFEKSGRTSSPRVMVWCNIIFLALVWVDFLRMIGVEWSVNDQYRYGYLVPYISAYLFYLRWEDRPDAQSSNRWEFFNIGVIPFVICVFGLKVIYEANPDWRLVYWAHAGLLFFLTLSIIHQWGGNKWMNHFWIPVVVLLFAVPWPTRLEQPMVQGLMRFVASLTVEIINLIGIPAVQKGNLIQLSNGLIGVEEACSGVRSFQSTLMSAVFLGELFRFNSYVRIGFVAIGSVTSITLNLIRTLTLTVITYKRGPEFMENWHDTIGYLVAICSFLILLGIALLIQKKSFARQKVHEFNRKHPEMETPMRWVRVSWMIPLLFFYLTTFPLISLWYHDKEEGSLLTVGTLDWVKASPNTTFEEIPKATRSMLRYRTGEKGFWIEKDKTAWTVFSLIWDKGKIGSFANVHRPETCLGAAGFQISAEKGMLIWEKDGLKIPFRLYKANLGTRTYHVFFSVWDDAQSNIDLTGATAQNRLMNVIGHKRIKNRRSLEIIVEGFSSLENATTSVIAFLDRSMVIEKKIQE